MRELEWIGWHVKFRLSHPLPCISIRISEWFLEKTRMPARKRLRGGRTIETRNRYSNGRDEMGEAEKGSPVKNRRAYDRLHGLVLDYLLRLIDGKVF